MLYCSYSKRKDNMYYIIELEKDFAVYFRNNLAFRGSLNECLDWRSNADKVALYS